MKCGPAADAAGGGGASTPRNIDVAKLGDALVAG
eukprot:COSAG06_NODE_42711_length_379_cov_0.785714_2_plen_33_part_01